MKKNKKAFTIIETLTTLLAITIMITAPLAFMYKSYKYADFINSKVIATGLSQEGLELATAFRNGDLDGFKNKISECTTSCNIDWDGGTALPTMSVCSGDSCTFAATDFNQNNNYYRSLKFTPNGVGGYLVESIAWSYVENIKVEAKLTKMFFEIKIKDTNI